MDTTGTFRVYEILSQYNIVTAMHKFYTVDDYLAQQQENSQLDPNYFMVSTGIHDPKAEKNFNLETIRKIMEVNYFGTINSINSVIDYFKDKKEGQISIVSSVAAYRGLPAAGAYCSSKSALSTFAESLYFDMKRHNVRVSLISPGFIKTPMTDQNEFKMPMIQSADFAANKIYDGLIKSNSFEIHFPKTFSYIMKIIKILPNWIYLGLIEKANRFMRR